jgi:hypothetical protein
MVATTGAVVIGFSLDILILHKDSVDGNRKSFAEQLGQYCPE